MASEVRRQIERLRAKSFGELAALPECDTRELHIKGTRFSVAIWRTIRSDGDLLVVVQCIRERLLGIYHRVLVEGFIASPTGAKSTAAEELLWDYT